MTTRIPCPTCGRMKPEFAIREGRCRDDRLDEQQAGETKAQLGWELRKVRNVQPND